MRYHSAVMDSARWDGFEFRSDDIVITTPPKCGTTWTQMLCALLIFDGPDFPAPLNEISPWLDMCDRTVADVHAALAAQKHRRFIKTHTPLDGIPMRDDVTYLVVGRDPRDVAISFEHHAANMDMDQFMERRAMSIGLADLADLPPPGPAIEDSAERFRRFVSDGTPGGPPRLAGMLHHLDTAWRRRSDANVTLFHYADLTADLTGEVLRLARALGIACSAEHARALIPEASLERMRDRASELAPRSGFWKDNRNFFRTGGFGEWRTRVSAADLAAYDARVASLVDEDLAKWVHLGRHGVRPDQKLENSLG